MKRSYVLALLLFTGCSGHKAYIADGFTRPHRIAVLPMSNETTDLDGPSVVRQLIFDRLKHCGYDVVALGDIDLKLNAEGFTDGGQLRAARPQQLGEWLDVDGLFYGTLVQFNYINLGYYWQRKVTVLGQLVQAATGEKLWESEKTWMTLNIATKPEDATKQFLGQLGTKAIEKTLRKPLYVESQIAVERLMDTLPSR